MEMEQLKYWQSNKRIIVKNIFVLLYPEMKIAALVSGGVDSSVVVHQLKEAGYDPVIFYIQIGMEDKGGYVDCPAEEDIEITTFIAQKYGCRMEVVSLHEEYWEKVVSYTIDAVRRGLTPNPDMMCNKLIKFGVFEEKWGHEFDRIATGHYATTTEIDGKTWLSTAADKVKDQTYFLAQVDYLQVSKLMFPIGHLQKSEVRTIAASQGLPSAQRKDSQGICFLGKINYNDFIRNYLGEQPGPIVELETGKTLGEHKGYWFHTIGQRKGLYLSGGPWFVIQKDIPHNIIYVSNGYDPETQYGKTVNLQGFHFITNNPWGNSTDERQITFKIRHTPEFTLGTLRRVGDIYRIVSDNRIQGIAAGQFGVIYDRDCRICLGSGMII
jgi:tRNA-specific 2-thiouridylase